jgi:hypothetical protein
MSTGVDNFGSTIGTNNMPNESRCRKRKLIIAATTFDGGTYRKVVPVN